MLRSPMLSNKTSVLGSAHMISSFVLMDGLSGKVTRILYTTALSQLNVSSTPPSHAYLVRFQVVAFVCGQTRERSFSQLTGSSVESEGSERYGRTDHEHQSCGGVVPARG